MEKNGANTNVDAKALDWLEHNQLSYDIWEKKYRYADETFDDWLNRISNNNEDVKKLILDKKFLFGGRILSNRGLQNKKKITYWEFKYEEGIDT